MNLEDCTLFSGAARGAEAAFGEAAERFGIAEVNFTFSGHTDARTRGVRVLSNDDLSKGDVSLGYVSRIMNRSYRDTPLFRRVLQSIWHQINAGDEVFVVGWILDDGTVKGGTGWGAEFAKLCNKPLCVFDQEKRTWFRWSELEWQEDKAPVISCPSFTGTGTRFLVEEGRLAIDELFERTFGA